MVVRKTRPRSPASTRPQESLPGATSGNVSRAAAAPVADDVPATAGMLRHLRTELVQRIEQGDNQLRDEMRQMKDDLVQRIEQGDNNLRDEMRQMKDELRGEMRQMKDELRGEMRQLGAGLSAVQNDVQDIKVHMARVMYLVEEQNVRNRIVLEGLTGLAARQDRVERRMDAVEETVRDLASSRRP